MRSEYKAICDQIMRANHDTVGVVFHKLDCGCMQFCGIAADGRLLGCRYHISGQPPTRNLEPLVCLRCRKDTAFAIERTVDQGIVWAANPPAPRQRRHIGRMVLGDEYEA
jgi:hypothetical protein